MYKLLLLIVFYLIYCNTFASSISRFCHSLNLNSDVGINFKELIIPIKDRLKVINSVRSLESCLESSLKYNFGPIKVYNIAIKETHLVIHTLDNGKKAYAKLIKGLDQISIRQGSVVSNNSNLSLFYSSLKGDLKEKTTIFIQTPYILFRNGISFLKDLIHYSKLNYNIVIQAIRGTYLSTGKLSWLDWKTQAKDSSATIEWIIKQNFSNKKVILLGTSYPAFAALSGVSTNHPAIIGALTASAPANPRLDSLSRGGQIYKLIPYLSTLNGDGHISNYVKYGDYVDKILQDNNDLKTKNSLIFNLAKPFINSSHLSSTVSTKISFSQNKGFIQKLNLSDIPTLHSYGIIYDQDSIDSMRTFNQMNLKKENHFLLEHNLGHSSKQFDPILKKLELVNTNLTRGKFKSVLRESLNEKRICQIRLDVEQNEFQKCFNQYSEINDYKKMHINLIQNPKGKSNTWSYFFKGKLVIYGRIKVKILHEKVSSNHTLYNYGHLVFSNKDLDIEVAHSNLSPVFKLGMNTTISEFVTNSTMMEINDDFEELDRINFELEPIMNLNDDQKLKVKSVQLEFNYIPITNP